jgi:hypothetical protein
MIGQERLYRYSSVCKKMRVSERAGLLIRMNGYTVKVCRASDGWMDGWFVVLGMLL